MKIQIFEDVQHNELCLVFCMGNQFTLYHNFMSDCSFKDILGAIDLGLDNQNLISLDTKSFVNVKKYKYSIEITYE